LLARSHAFWNELGNTSVPSENFRPSRIWKVQTVASSLASNDSATCGTISGLSGSLASMSVRPS
jgi:hypothetical protein